MYDRIDKFLTLILKFSRKKVINLILNNYVTVNGKVVKKSYSVKAKDEIKIKLINDTVANHTYPELKVLYEDDNLLAIYKPPFIHSARLEKSIRSVEDYLLSLNKSYTLLNRLDFITQGVILVAKNSFFLTYYKEQEKFLNIKKYYISFLKGRLYNELEVSYAINQSKRKKVQINRMNKGKNFTLFSPVAIYNDFTIANICIFKGARHQIRAHAACSGFPVEGDKLYGTENDTRKFFLLCYGYYFKNKKLFLNFFPNFKQKIKERITYI